MADPTSSDAPVVRSDKPSALDRARADLAAGRPDLARDRLTGFLYTLHCRGEYLEPAYALLGETYFTMQDFAKAGAAWLLTTRTGADVEQAVQAFYARFGNASDAVLQQLKAHAPSEAYPPSVQERLKALGYRYRSYRPRSNPHAQEELEGKQSGLRPVEVGCLMVCFASTVGVILFFILY